MGESTRRVMLSLPTSRSQRRKNPVTRPRVLLADDHKDCDSVVRLLTPEFEVVGVVQDGQQLLSAESGMLPDVCVIDISMPGMYGIEAARILKATGSERRLFF